MGEVSLWGRRLSSLRSDPALVPNESPIQLVPEFLCSGLKLPSVTLTTSSIQCQSYRSLQMYLHKKAKVHSVHLCEFLDFLLNFFIDAFHRSSVSHGECQDGSESLSTHHSCSSSHLFGRSICLTSQRNSMFEITKVLITW
jgi:hypothetical protein